MDKVCRIFDKDFDYFLEEKINVTNNIEKVEGINVGYSNSGPIHMVPKEILSQLEERLTKLEEEFSRLKK
ncbi:hypothetical protein [Moheibacter sediminis]|uniref:Uncharacterized protein n=1 Tax=Moheibacter sediminis TaxID=1434700 RepID=A0A1W1ZL16_9FLAO|nr:hypothetical protein [Moheibacter sediminis]SMC49250.1 hypothetical protein SAMN06296427_10359 [Moheibacter sediminis]